MGQEPSKGSLPESSESTSSFPRANTGSPSSSSPTYQIPYTSFSVPKIQGASSNALRKLSLLTNRVTTPVDQQKKEQQLSTPTKKSGDDIISVVTLNGQGEVKVDETYPDAINDVIESRNNVEKDELLRELKQLTEFYPLIRAKVETTNSPLSSILKFTKKDYFTSSSNTNNVFTDPSLKELDCIDTKPLVDICAEFQTNAMHNNRAVAFRQDEVLKLLSHTCSKSSTTAKFLEKKNAELHHVASELRDVERLDRYVEQTRKYVDLILLQIQELESLLPHSVRAQLDTPLFEKCKNPFEEDPQAAALTEPKQQ
ncbi:hypothetical protein C9374_001705 [Naegleria lovaniensis]|uniref:BLOC-1-related complex subunit 5 n=1 Tax=Naegleria lovaniensis TaxID=51637 RepID=A0AA88GX95_NAELO|nr:uncharacterized protein C9374_001705 [Naegleria lovaniensis]KAG2387373.1 hypothetical protein C9374_001705 [Naegleria lovaniensis]